ncbi:hypothetical protein MHB75_05260 [Kurthia sp. FSL E2-0154]|uniref:hypothetical protein n=1 Tax=Kurthia sp. FSL E2-0154 TaxID=2921358 RepID=UPI0030FC8735
MKKSDELRTAVRLNYAKVATQNNDCCTTNTVSCCNPEENLQQSPEELAQKMGYSGAISIETYEELLRNAGFKDIQIEPKDESKEFIRDWEPNYDLENYIVSALIQARK